MAAIEILPARFSILRAVALIGQRRALKSLSDERLLDLGLSRAQAEREASRPVWDAPEHWYSC